MTEKQLQLKKRREQEKAIRHQANKLHHEIEAGFNKGLRCPACGCAHFYTDKTVDVPGRRRRRYKTCRNCGRRVRTTEIIETE
jgi:hypothetical protein